MTEQRYQVVERIAAGGMAEVYRGESAGIEGFRKKVADQARLAEAVAKSRVHSHVLGRGALVRLPESLQVRAGVRHRASRGVRTSS